MGVTLAFLFHSEINLSKAAREAKKQEAAMTLDDRREVQRIAEAYLSSVVAAGTVVPTRSMAVQFRE